MTPYSECDHKDRLEVPKDLGGRMTFPHADGSGQSPPGKVEVCRGCGTVIVEVEPADVGRVGFTFRLPPEGVAILAESVLPADPVRRINQITHPNLMAPEAAYRAILLHALDTESFRQRARKAIAKAALDAARQG